MKVAVSYNKAGEITLMFDPSKMKGDKFTIGYAPAPGENHQVLDVPQGLQGKPINEIAHMMRVNGQGAEARLEAKA